MVFINDVLAQNAKTRELPLATSAYAFEPQQVEDHLRAHIVGQDHAINSIRQQLNIIKAGLYDPRRPLLSALFLGDTGTGKTETVRQIARAIHGRDDAFCRIDMNTLSQSHYSAAITGAPPGYVGSKDNLTMLNDELISGTLTRPGIVLFDEIEKASTDVVRSLMNILDNGMLRLASGQKEISFRNTLVFMTSNAGSRQWQQAHAYHWLPAFLQARKRSALQKKALFRHFDSEFLNRIGCIESFKPLDFSSLPQITELQISELNQMLKRHRVHVTFPQQVRLQLLERGYEQHFGARSLQRLFNRKVMAPLASTLLTMKQSQQPVELIAQLDGDTLFFTLGTEPQGNSAPSIKAVSAIKGEDHD